MSAGWDPTFDRGLFGHTLGSLAPPSPPAPRPVRPARAASARPGLGRSMLDIARRGDFRARLSPAQARASSASSMASAVSRPATLSVVSSSRGTMPRPPPRERRNRDARPRLRRIRVSSNAMGGQSGWHETRPADFSIGHQPTAPPAPTQTETRPARPGLLNEPEGGNAQPVPHRLDRCSGFSEILPCCLGLCRDPWGGVAFLQRWQ